jgi:hypothetical protein
MAFDIAPLRDLQAVRPANPQRTKNFTWLQNHTRNNTGGLRASKRSSLKALHPEPRRAALFFSSCCYILSSIMAWKQFRRKRGGVAFKF